MVHYSCTDISMLGRTLNNLGRSYIWQGRPLKCAIQTCRAKYKFNADAPRLSPSHMRGIAHAPVSNYVDWFKCVATCVCLHAKFDHWPTALTKLGISLESVNDFMRALPISNPQLKCTAGKSNFPQ